MTNLPDSNIVNIGKNVLPTKDVKLLNRYPKDLQSQVSKIAPGPEATVTIVSIWKPGVSKLGILKSLGSHVLNKKVKLNLFSAKLLSIHRHFQTSESILEAKYQLNLSENNFVIKNVPNF